MSKNFQESDKKSEYVRLKFKLFYIKSIIAALCKGAPKHRFSESGTIKITR